MTLSIERVIAEIVAQDERETKADTRVLRPGERVSLTGLEGPQGPAGEDGLRGEKGDIGGTGLQGPQGPIGPQGPQGEPGRDGVDGEDGKDGLRGPQGERGPEGPKGPRGDSIVGPQGPPGQSGGTTVFRGGGGGGGGTSLSGATPLIESGLGTPGTSSSASRDDHVHPAAAGGSLSVRSGVGAPSGAPDADELPIGIDTGTGFVYLWNGVSWLEMVTT